MNWLEFTGYQCYLLFPATTSIAYGWHPCYVLYWLLSQKLLGTNSDSSTRRDMNFQVTPGVQTADRLYSSCERACWFVSYDTIEHAWRDAGRQFLLGTCWYERSCWPRVGRWVGSLSRPWLRNLNLLLGSTAISEHLGYGRMNTQEYSRLYKHHETMPRLVGVTHTRSGKQLISQCRGK